MKRPFYPLALIVVAVLAVAGIVLFVAPSLVADRDEPPGMTGVPQPDVQVTVANGRLVLPAAGSDEAMIFLDLINRSDAAIYLTQAGLDGSGPATIAYLRPPSANRASSLTIPEGETLSLSPDSGYAILTDYDASVVPGATVPLTLKFSTGEIVRVPLTVQSMVGQGGVVRMPEPPQG